MQVYSWAIFISSLLCGSWRDLSMLLVSVGEKKKKETLLMSLQLPSLSKQSQQSDFVLSASPPSLIICLSFFSSPSPLAHTFIKQRQRSRTAQIESRQKPPHKHYGRLPSSPITPDITSLNRRPAFYMFHVCLCLSASSFNVEQAIHFFYWCKLWERPLLNNLWLLHKMR